MYAARPRQPYRSARHCTRLVTFIKISFGFNLIEFKARLHPHQSSHSRHLPSARVRRVVASSVPPTFSSTTSMHTTTESASFQRSDNNKVATSSRVSLGLDGRQRRGGPVTAHQNARGRVSRGMYRMNGTAGSRASQPRALPADLPPGDPPGSCTHVGITPHPCTGYARASWSRVAASEGWSWRTCWGRPVPRMPCHVVNRRQHVMLA